MREREEEGSDRGDGERVCWALAIPEQTRGGGRVDSEGCRRESGERECIVGVCWIAIFLVVSLKIETP